MTRTTRRALLGASALGAAVAPLLVAPNAFAAATMRRNLYARSRFTSLRQRTFRLDGAGGSWRIRLVKVGNLSHSAQKDDHAFSLTFTCGRRGPEQGSYVLRRPGFRPTTLFLVPSDAGRRTYEAIVLRTA